MKALCVNILISIVAVIFVSNSVSVILTFKSVKCNASNFSVFPNYSCYIKPYRRNVGAATFQAHISRRLYYIFINAHILYRQRISSYYRTIINGTINLCDILNSSKSDNPIMKVAFEFLNEVIPKGQNHPCPYDVSSRLNITLLLLKCTLS
jgi:hypothetical protein